MLNVIGGLSRRENMHDEYEYMFMCPAETKQLFLSFYNITGREKKEEKKKAIFINEMNLFDHRPLPYPWNTTDEIDEEMEMTFSLNHHRPLSFFFHSFW